MDMCDRIKKCPFVRSVGNSEESMDMCKLTERPSGRIKVCLLVSGDTCEEWTEIQGEIKKEK